MIDETLENARCFHRVYDSVLMATATEDGEPVASYAPYLEHGGDFYVYVSDLAAHTQNLKRNPRASLMFIEDEG